MKNSGQHEFSRHRAGVGIGHRLGRRTDRDTGDGAGRDSGTGRGRNGRTFAGPDPRGRHPRQHRLRERRKRNAKQIVDSVVSEDVGKLPDNNVPEALSRVTGVQIDRARGEGQNVTIRGLSDVQTTINGNQPGLGEGRSLNLADIPAELLKSVEVYKTRTADQVEGGIAGTVNVELRRPLDLKKGLTVAGSFRETFSDDIGDTKSPYASLSAGRPFRHADRRDGLPAQRLLHQEQLSSRTTSSANRRSRSACFIGSPPTSASPAKLRRRS
jgi:iron complex outermembrane receptor protein